MPAEWAPHACTWMAWPCDDDLSIGELEPVRREFTAFIRAIAAREPVRLLVRDTDAEQDARERLQGADVRFHHYRYDDVWLRDSGPTFIGNGGRLRLLNWEFNGWGEEFHGHARQRRARFVAGLLNARTIDTGIVLEGGSIEVNGAGSLLTTRQCLLSKKRNPSLGEAEIEGLLQATLGVSQVLWLDAGLEGDHTDGHIDTITRFVDETTIVTVSCDDRSDPNHAVTQANTERLRSFRDVAGRMADPFPGRGAAVAEGAGGVRGRAAAAHLCQLLSGERRCPGSVFGDTQDERALEILRGLFPGRAVTGIMARHLITGGGAFHCVTQQQPAGTVVDEL